MSLANTHDLKKLLNDLRATKNKLSEEIDRLDELYRQINQGEENEKAKVVQAPEVNSIDSHIITGNDNPFNLYMYMNIDDVIFENRGSQRIIRPSFLDLLSWASNYFYCTIITDYQNFLSEYMTKKTVEVYSKVSILDNHDYDDLEDAIDPYNDFYLIHNQEDLDNALTGLYDDNYKDRCIQLEKKPIDDIRSDLYEIIESRFRKLKNEIDDQRTDSFSSYVSLSTPTNWTFDKDIKGRKKIELNISYVNKYTFEYIWKVRNEVTGSSKIIKHSKTLTQLIEDYKLLPQLLKQLEESMEKLKLVK